MNARYILYIAALISCIQYWIAPESYSLSHCYVCFSVFLVCFVVVFKYRVIKNFIGFEFIFSFAFLYTNYLYPTFLYGINSSFSLFGLEFPENYINKGIALVTVGYAFFALGLLKYPCVAEFRINNRFNEFKEPKFYKPISIILLLLLIGTLIPVYLSGVYDGNFGEGAFYKVVSDIFVYYLIYEAFSHSKSVKRLIKGNLLFFALVIIYVALMTLIGNRGMFIRISVLILFCYNIYIRKVKTKYFVVMLLLGMALMTFVGQERGGGSGRSSFEGNMPTALLLGKDLIINNRSLYVLMDYGDKHGLTFGRTSVLDFMAVIPFGQSLVMKLTGYTQGDLNSASLVTDLHYQGNDENRIGLGTNIIGDIYVSFGLLGVVVLMYLLGKLISKWQYKGMNGDMLSLFIYAIFTMIAIIHVRSPFFSILRPVLWSVALYYVGKRCYKTSVNKY